MGWYVKSLVHVIYVRNLLLLKPLYSLAFVPDTILGIQFRDINAQSILFRLLPVSLIMSSTGPGVHAVATFLAMDELTLIGGPISSLVKS